MQMSGISFRVSGNSYRVWNEGRLLLTSGFNRR